MCQSVSWLTNLDIKLTLYLWKSNSTFYLPGRGTFTLPTFKLLTILRARMFWVQNHLVNSYLCVDGVLRLFFGHLDSTHEV